MKKAGIFGALALAALVGKIAKGSKGGKDTPANEDAIDNLYTDAENDEYMRDFFDEHDPSYVDELEPSVHGRKFQTDDEGDGLMMKIGKGVLSAMKSASEQAQRRQEQIRRERERDCNRMERWEKKYDEDFDKLQQDFDRDFPKMDD